jgi:hypothetical protein
MFYYTFRNLLKSGAVLGMWVGLVFQISATMAREGGDHGSQTKYCHKAACVQHHSFQRERANVRDGRDMGRNCADECVRENTAN